LLLCGEGSEKDVIARRSFRPTWQSRRLLPPDQVRGRNDTLLSSNYLSVSLQSLRKRVPSS
jgi:hypothetical protein